MLRRSALLLIMVFALLVFAGILLVNSLNVVQRVTLISHVRGVVEVKEPGETSFRRLTGETRVLAGTILRTGKNGSALLHWVDGTRLQAGAETTLKILKCCFDKRTNGALSLFKLEVGRIWIRVIRALSSDSKFEIQTPTATAGVRGTTFSVEVEPDGATEIFVYEGEVRVKAGKQTYGVNDGHALAVRPGGNVEARELGSQERSLDEWGAVIKPLLVVTRPKDGQQVPLGEKITVRGYAEPGARLVINDTDVSLRADGSFSYDYMPAQKRTEIIRLVETDSRNVKTTQEVKIHVQ